jgi:hypothetical protein
MSETKVLSKPSMNADPYLIEVGIEPKNEEGFPLLENVLNQTAAANKSITFSSDLKHVVLHSTNEDDLEKTIRSIQSFPEIRVHIGQP